jgi:hypothetical protein
MSMCHIAPRAFAPPDMNALGSHGRHRATIDFTRRSPKESKIRPFRNISVEIWSFVCTFGLDSPVVARMTTRPSR